MDRIYINLSPKKENVNNLLFHNLTYYLALGVVLVACIILLLGFFLVIKLGACKHYESRWSKWKDQYATLSVIKKELTALQNEKDEFAKILTPTNEMAKLFKDIYVSLPQNIWFESLNFTKNTLNIKGYVVRINEDYLVSLENFITSLKAKEYFVSRFTKVNIKDSQQKDINGIEVLEFYLECAN